jgi:hypothetical protein
MDYLNVIFNCLIYFEFIKIYVRIYLKIRGWYARFTYWSYYVLRYVWYARIMLWYARKLCVPTVFSSLKYISFKRIISKGFKKISRQRHYKSKTMRDSRDNFKTRQPKRDGYERCTSHTRSSLVKTTR